MTRPCKIAAAIAILISLGIFCPRAVHNSAKSALAEYRKQLQAQGEKLTIAEIAPRVTAAQETGARDLMAAIAPLSSGLADYPAAMKNIAPGRALVAWAEKDLPAMKTTNIWPEVSRRVLEHEQDLATLREGLANPDIRFNVDYNPLSTISFSHLARLKQATLWLYAATLVELHEGHPTNALEDLESCVALGESLEHEPMLISQMVRMAMAQIALGGTWELLQYPSWQAAQLAGLQTEWDSSNFLDEAGPSLEMERAMMPTYYDLGRLSHSNIYTMPTGNPPTLDSLGEFLANPKDSYQAIMDRYPRYWAWKRHWSYMEELYNLQSQEAGLDCARLMMRNGTACIPASKNLNSNLTTIENAYTNVSAHFYFGLDGRIFSSYLLRLVDMEMERRMVVTAIALKRYQIQSGKFPTDLKALVPDYLHEVPLDLMDGKPLRYHPNADGTFLLYSVGEDGEDNGGDPTPTQSTPYPFWAKGRDAVWPMPAAPEEIKAYKEKLIAEWNAQEEHKNQTSRRGPRQMPPPITNTN